MSENPGILEILTRAEIEELMAVLRNQDAVLAHRLIDRLDATDTTLRARLEKAEARIEALEKERPVLAIAQRIAGLEDVAMAGVNFTELRNLVRELKTALAA